MNLCFKLEDPFQHSVAQGVFFQDLCPIQHVYFEILEYVWGISSILACRSSTSRFSSSSTQLPVPVATSRIGTAVARPLRGLLLWPLGDQRWFWRYQPQMELVGHFWNKAIQVLGLISFLPKV